MGGTMRNALFVTIAIGLGLVLGCATKGVMPTENLTKAETAIQSAQTAEARTYAPLDLKLAEDKLAEAQAAAGREDYDGARRLADEALVNAQLAEKKADSERAKRAAQEMRDTIEALRRAVREPKSKNVRDDYHRRWIMTHGNKGNRLTLSFKMIILSAVLSLFAHGCASVPMENPALTSARAAYEKAKGDPKVAANASVPLYEAGQTLKSAEMATSDAEMSHLAYLAEKQTAIAVATAEQKVAEAEREKLAADKDRILLEQRERQARGSR